MRPLGIKIEKIPKANLRKAFIFTTQCTNTNEKRNGNVKLKQNNVTV